MDPSVIEERIRERGANLPEDARLRAIETAADYPKAREASDDLQVWLRVVQEGLAEKAINDSSARQEWRVSFAGSLSPDARTAIGEADDAVLVSGHTVAGVESHTVIVIASGQRCSAPPPRENHLKRKTGDVHRIGARLGALPSALSFAPLPCTRPRTELPTSSGTEKA
jgi:hypothetical protein